MMAIRHLLDSCHCISSYDVTGDVMLTSVNDELSVVETRGLRERITVIDQLQLCLLQPVCHSYYFLDKFDGCK